MIEVRPLAAEDVKQVIATCIEAHGAREEWGVRALIESGPERSGGWCVAVDGGRVVSTVCLMRHLFRMRTVDLPAGQIEYVNTLPDYRNRGLIRELIAEVHRWSGARGDLFTFITGIPFFYRQFGYDFGLAYPPLRPVDLDVIGDVGSLPEGWAVTDAQSPDLPALRSLLDGARAPSELVQVRSDEEWDWLFGIANRWGHRSVVARHDETVRATAGIVHGLGRTRTYLVDVAAIDVAGAGVVLAEAADVARAAGTPLSVMDRPGTPVSALLGELEAGPGTASSIYTRVADPVAFLDRIRPVLSARLAASPFAVESGALELSFYRSGLRIDYEAGEVLAVTATPGDPEADEHDGVGIPPDLVATLLLGRFGASGLEVRSDDVYLGRHALLMDVLFPKVTTDITTVL